MNRMLRMWFETEFDYTWYIALVITIIVVPLCLIRDISKFSFAHFIGDLAVLLTVVCLAYETIAQMIGDPTFNIDNVKMFNSHWYKLLGMSITSLEGIGVVLPIKVRFYYNSI